MSLDTDYRIFFLNNIIQTLYGADRLDIHYKRTGLLEEAVTTKGYTCGRFLIYYDGADYIASINGSLCDMAKTIRFDLQDEFITEMLDLENQQLDLEDEVHNVEGLLRSVLNASESHSDIHALMPKQIHRKCPTAFYVTRDLQTLLNSEVEEFNHKHEKMLSGLKQKVLRDLLLKKK